MNRPSKILVAGIGNIFLGDDAFGSEVARRLMNERLPPEVRVIDFINLTSLTPIWRMPTA
jgi:hydrogenase maturation protease